MRWRREGVRLRRLGCLTRGRVTEPLGELGRNPVEEIVPLQTVHDVRGGKRVGHAGARSDSRRVVAGYVGNGEDLDLRVRECGSETPASPAQKATPDGIGILYMQASTRDSPEELT